MFMFEVKNLSYAYESQGCGSEALRGISFGINLDAPEKIALVGANGSGKSTLLCALAGCFAQDRAMGGEIFIDGHAATPEQLRETVGLIFQESDDQLFMPSVLEDVAFGPVAHGVTGQIAQTHAKEILERLGIEHLADRVPQRMSGGEKRMAALAGILVMSPRVIVLDEPTSSLDPRARRRVINILRDLEIPILLATHDLRMALELCSRAIILQDGVIAASGALPELFRDAALLTRCGLEPDIL